MTKIAEIHSMLSHKAELTHVDQALARKVDIRTFLASQASDANARSANAALGGSTCNGALWNTSQGYLNTTNTSHRAAQSFPWGNGTPPTLEPNLMTPLPAPVAMTGMSERETGQAWMYSSPQLTSSVSRDASEPQAHLPGTRSGSLLMSMKSANGRDLYNT